MKLKIKKETKNKMATPQEYTNLGNARDYVMKPLLGKKLVLRDGCSNSDSEGGIVTRILSDRVEIDGGPGRILTDGLGAYDVVELKEKGGKK